MARKRDTAEMNYQTFETEEFRQKVLKKLEEDFWREQQESLTDVQMENERLRQIISDLQRVQKEHQEKIADMKERIDGYLQEIRIYEHESSTLRHIIIDSLRRD